MQLHIYITLNDAGNEDADDAAAASLDAKETCRQSAVTRQQSLLSVWCINTSKTSADPTHAAHSTVT